MRSRTIFAVAAIPLLLLLTACTASGTPSAAGTIAPPPAPAVQTGPVASPGPVERDTTLIVKATVTAKNGAQLALEMRVHQSIPFDDIAGQTLPAVMAQECADTLSPTIFKKDRWSFTRANITAVPTAASMADWPGSDRIDLRPSAKFVAIAAKGFLVDDRTVSAAVPSCRQDKIFTAAGTGGIAIGIAGDTAEAGAAGGFTRWANHSFGFDTKRSPGVTLTSCTFEVTPLGAKYNGGTASWSSLNDARTCVTGAANETRN